MAKSDPKKATFAKNLLRPGNHFSDFLPSLTKFFTVFATRPHPKMSKPTLYSSATELVLACSECSASTLADCLCRLPRESCSAWMERGRVKAARVRRSKAFDACARMRHVRSFKAGGARERAAVRLQSAARGILGRRFAAAVRAVQVADRRLALHNLAAHARLSPRFNRILPSNLVNAIIAEQEDGSRLIHSAAQCQTCYPDPSVGCRADCPIRFRNENRARLECLGCGNVFCRFQEACFVNRCSKYRQELFFGPSNQYAQNCCEVRV